MPIAAGKSGGGGSTRSGRYAWHRRPDHNVWSGGALPVAVTLAGWAALLKGVTLLLIPPERMADWYKGVGFERFFVVWMIVVLALGLWLAWLAFAA